MCHVERNISDSVQDLGQLQRSLRFAQDDNCIAAN
jgi:hypothetical protein